MTEQNLSSAQTVPERTIQTVTLEIQTIHAQANQAMLSYAIEIGRRLVEAKALLKHGTWGDWLKNEVSFSKSTANNLMLLFEEYGDRQMGLFGAEVKSQSLGNLPYTKALKLLALPEEERESFVDENKVDEMSTRELERAIKEKKDAEDSRDQLHEELSQLKAELKTLQEKPVEVAVKTVVDETAVKEAVERAEASEKRVETLEKDKQEAESKVAEVEKRLTEEKETLLADVKGVEEQKKTLERRIAELEKQSKEGQNPEITRFRVHFDQAKKEFNQLAEILERLKTGGDPSADKLSLGLKFLLERCLSEVMERE